MTPSPRPRSTRFWQQRTAEVKAAIQEARSHPEIAPAWEQVRGLCAGLWDLSDIPPTVDDLAQLWEAIAALAHLIRQHGLALGELWGTYLEENLMSLLMGAQVYAATGRLPARSTPQRQERLAPGNPLTVAPDGGLHGWQQAQPAHLLQLHSYAKSLQSPGRPGRPRRRPRQDKKSERSRIDPEKAARALQMKRDGKPLPVIAAAVGLSYDPHDRRACKAVQERIRRWIERALVNEYKKVHDPR
jgi:hypothetical protein